MRHRARARGLVLAGVVAAALAGCGDTAPAAGPATSVETAVTEAESLLAELEAELAADS